MSQPEPNDNDNTRDLLAGRIVGYSFLLLAGIFAFSLLTRPDKSFDILNLALPMVATWVGTVIAFYFGQKNFEEATKLTIRQLSPKERENSAISGIMRPLSMMTTLTHKDDLTLKEIRAHFTDKITRLPILRDDHTVLYMLHASSVDKYMVDAKKDASDTLANMLAHYTTNKIEFTDGHGFVVVSKNTPLKEAKKKMEHVKSCQDIFVTETGNVSEPLLGWVSNVRMAKFLNS